MPLICSNTRWYRMLPTAPYSASRDERFTSASPRRLKASFLKLLKANLSC